MTRSRLVACCSAFALALAAVASRAEEDPHAAHRALPGDAPAAAQSIYQIPGAWRDQDDRPFEFASLRGAPVVIALFYGTCDSICPTLVRDVKKIEALLPASERARTRFVLATIDPKVDTTERLRAYAEKNGLDASRWRLVNGGEDGVRVLANVLGVKYRPTGTGQYSHTIRITVLDAEGVVVDHVDGLDRPLDPIAARVSSLLATPAP